ANDAPVIISSATVSVPENTTGVTTVVATDPDAGSVLTYSIVGGADLGKFSINSSTGALSFIAAPNFEIPTDVGANNIYDVIVQASDGTLTTSQAIAVRVTNVNEAPVNTVPGAQTTNEDISKVITGLSISDVDALAGIMTVTLGVTNGTLAVSGGSAAISGSGTSTVTLTGTVAQINSTLSAANSVTYVPTNNYSGTATLTMTTNDNGNTGSGGAQSDTDTVTINITAVADTPILSLPASVSVVNPGNFTISNTAAISQAGLETDLGLSSGFLDGFDPLAGSVASSDPGNVNVIDGALANSSYRLSNGAQIAFDWQFTNAENIQSEINGGYNDMVFLVVTLPNGTQQTFQITSSEQAGAGVNTTGTYTYTASQSGNYQFSWLVVNGLDNQKDSSLSITNTKTIISSTNYGKPISIPVINAALKDTDGSESLKVRISGVPSGGILSAGTAIGGGVWEFTNISDLTGLIYYPPTSFTTGNINLTVTATATEASNGSTATTSSTLTISVDQASTVTYGAETGTTTTGTAGNDWIHALPGNDTVNAAGGNDLVYGGAGDDTSLSGGAGNDTIYGGLGNDTISGGDGNDLLFGEAGDDNITGGTGNDMLYGGVGDDKLDGELGNDILVGGQGSDTLTGGGGIDTFVWLSGDNTGGTLANPIQDKITDFKANPVGGPSPDVSILNLSALLGGEHLNADSLDNYLNISKSGTGDTLIKIDPSGTDPVTNATQTILLQGVDLTNVFATTNSHEIITNLIANGNLITDA
ncbi:type I secretion C-terminal target domain-containing protein, partial [Legionella waltersii]